MSIVFGDNAYTSGPFGARQQLLGQRWKSLSIPATRALASATNPALDTTIPGLLFQSTATNYGYITLGMPLEWVEGTPLVPYVEWSKTTSAVGGVHWELAYRWGRPGEVVSANWTLLASATPLVTHGDTANQCALTVLPNLPTTGRRVGDTLFLRIGRVHTQPAGDLYAANARLHEVGLRMLVNDIGSEDPRVKV